MESVDLSPALGTFVAGVVLSDSEYRHELESDIAPFKGLLLGLFFISVGAGIDFRLLLREPLAVFGLAGAIMVGKLALLLGLARLFNIPKGENWLFALGLAQAGEFAFVLFGFALTADVLPPALVQLLTLVVTVTMLFTPLLFICYEKIVAPRVVAGVRRDADVIDDQGTVVVAGVGRFGQVVSRFLRTNGHKVIVLDHDPALIDLVGRFGVKTYYGDATRPDLLHAAGLEDARLFVAALDEREAQTVVVAHVAKHYPNCRIAARAFDRHHLYELEQAGAHVVERETFEAALSAGRRSLIELGAHPFRAQQKAQIFRRHDYGTLDVLRETFHDEGIDKGYIGAARARNAELEEVMQADRADRHDTTERGWTPPPSGDAAS
jgi:CPA2 family monovalent cation:H+ antiporter-2/glutathione-regulated potassium-efflux system ancillary protein KefC